MPDKMMRAVSQDRLGPPDVLHMVTVPRPEPGGTEVRVRVLAAGVNPVDWKTRADGGRLARRRSSWAGMSPASWKPLAKA